MKKVLSLAIAAALVAPVAAMADATVYGKVRVGVDLVDYDANGEAGDIDEWQINDKTSRLGVKGSEDLGNGLKAIYKIEAQVRMLGETNEAGTASSLFTGRNAFVGLSGDFGTALIGRHDTPLKMSTGKLDYFSDTSADNNGGQIDNVGNSNYTEALVDIRLDGALVYISPSLNGLTLAGAIAPGENSDNGTTGDLVADGLADIYSIAGMYSNAGLYLSAAYEAADGNTDLLGDDGADWAAWRLGGGWDAGMWKVAAVYEAISQDDGSDLDTEDERDSTTWVISGGVKLGPGMAKAKYFSFEDDSDQTENHDGWAIGYDYNLSKRTQASVLYVASTFDEQPAGQDDIEVGVFGVQMNHNF